MSFNIDHVVITVSDINKSIDFYSNILGMELQEFSSSTDNVKRKSLKFGKQKINLHEASKPFKPHANKPLPGTMDICFLSDININEWLKNGMLIGSHTQNHVIAKTDIFRKPSTMIPISSGDLASENWKFFLATKGDCPHQIS